MIPRNVIQGTISVLFLFQFACSPKESQLQDITPESHAQEVEEWYQKRVASLKKESGWLNLIGLEWLEDGSNSFGTAPGDKIKLSTGRISGSLGVFVLDNGKVYFEPGVGGIKADSIDIKDRQLVFDAEASVSRNLQFQSLRWNIIKRSEAYGVRIRDLEAPAVLEFEGIERYPVSLEWRVVAKFVPYEPAKEIMITNVLGQTTPNPSPGYLEFEKNGQTFKIDALEEGDQLFLIIADDTSGGDTYGGGRYLYVPKPTNGSDVVIDFNKAYNPPCVFTPHATCPLPPRQNMLSLAVEAGEKTFGEH